MMTYDFACTCCEFKTAVTYKISEVPKFIECPWCEENMQQVISGDNPFILNGKGWDKPAHYK